MTKEHWEIAENISVSAERYVRTYGGGFKYITKDWRDIVGFSKQLSNITDDDTLVEQMHRIIDGFRKYRGKRTKKEMISGVGERGALTQTQVAYNRYVNDLYALESLLDPQGCAAEPDADLTWLE